MFEYEKPLYTFSFVFLLLVPGILARAQRLETPWGFSVRGQVVGHLHENVRSYFNHQRFGDIFTSGFAVDGMYDFSQLYGVRVSASMGRNAGACNSQEVGGGFYPILQEVVDFMKQNPDVHATIEGHACILGFDSVNQPLSERRAQAVYDYLHGHGISYDRLEAKGYGSKRPKVSNETEHGRRQNRRIEFIFALK